MRFLMGTSPNCLILIVQTMTNYRKKIPALKDGVAKQAMQLLFQQVKAHRGLTSFIERHGINGMWLKIEEPMDIPVSKLFKILLRKAQYQTEDEFISDWNEAGRKFLKWARRNKGEK